MSLKCVKLLTLLLLCLVQLRCTTAVVEPEAIFPAKAPEYIGVVHPDGLSISDLSAVFLAQGAPPRESLKKCHGSFDKLAKVSQSREELFDGSRELVKAQPEFYHWCFYNKLLEMNEIFRALIYVDEKQKLVLGSYEFLTPIAKAFQAEYNDSRYLRWAIANYRVMSEGAFFRKVELSNESMRDLAMPANPFGLVKSPEQSNVQKNTVLERYGVAALPTESDGVMPLGTGVRALSRFEEIPPEAVEQEPDTGVPQSALEAPREPASKKEEELLNDAAKDPAMSAPAH